MPKIPTDPKLCVGGPLDGQFLVADAEGHTRILSQPPAKIVGHWDQLEFDPPPARVGRYVGDVGSEVLHWQGWDEDDSTHDSDS